MGKEARVIRLECAYRQIITHLDQVQQSQNWKTNPAKVVASLEIAAREAVILAELARLKQSYPHARGALECLRETNGYAGDDLTVGIARQAIIATLRFPKYVDDSQDADLDLGKFDTAFNRFATLLHSAAKIARVTLGLD